MNRKRIGKRIVCVMLTGGILFGQEPMQVSAAADSSEKEEVVYAMLDTSGNVTGIYVVNSFTDSDITDYGDYTSVRNLTTTDTLSMDNGKITVNSSADKLYYQGNLEKKDIPWEIEIHYYMDDKEYSAEDIAGMDGKLKICIDITQNDDCDSSFWDGYALQAALTLDSNKCKNIVAENATIANVGSDKQLAYVIMPGKGANLEITADVTDFEMSEISINATKLNLDLELDSDELTDQIAEIQDAVKELNDGAAELKDGAGELNDGAKQVYDGSVTLQDGASTLNSGVASLNDGIGTMKQVLDTLNGKSSTLTSGSSQVLSALQTIQTSLNGVSMNADDLKTLSSSSTQIKQGLDTLVAGLQTMDGSIGTYYQSLSDAGLTDVNTFVSQHNEALSALGITDTQRALYQAYVTSGDSGVQTKLAELAQTGNGEAIALAQNPSALAGYLQNAGALISVETLLNADIAYIQGSNALIAGIDGQLDSQSGELMMGAVTLQTSYATFDSSIQQMVGSLNSLVTNMATLKNGVDTLVTQYGTLDTGISEYTNAVASITSGYEKIYSGALAIATGTNTLYQGTTELVSGTLELYNGSSDLSEGTADMKSGTEEFYDSTKDMDTEVTESIDETIDDMTGKNVETVSFVSDKNTNVKSVLFIIKTPAVEKAEVKESEEEPEEELNAWQKFVKLFQ